MNLELNNRKALISGANRGIGRIDRARLRRRRHASRAARPQPAGVPRSSRKRSARTHRDVKAVAVHVDLEQPQTIEPAVEKAVSALGGIDILVNCAGGAYRGRLAEIPDEMWERYFKVKPLGLIRMTREAVPHLKKSSQGRVINISGTRGREPEAHSIMSGPINFGTLSVTKALANELGPFGITVERDLPRARRARGAGTSSCRLRRATASSPKRKPKSICCGSAAREGDRARGYRRSRGLPRVRPRAAHQRHRDQRRRRPDAQHLMSTSKRRVEIRDMNKLYSFFVLVVTALCALPHAHAQTYPSKPIRIIVPLAAGGGNDNIAESSARNSAKAWASPCSWRIGPAAAA